MDFYPNEVALEYLAVMGIDFEAIYNGQDGMQRAQLTALSALPFFKKDVKKNAYKTIHRLDASANKKSIDFAKNLQNTLSGTISTELMQSIETETTPKKRKDTMIVWLPSSADEQDPFHALNYGKTMTLQAALDKGLGTRYGCKCGMRISEKDIEDENLNNLVNNI